MIEVPSSEIKDDLIQEPVPFSDKMKGLFLLPLTPLIELKHKWEVTNKPRRRIYLFFICLLLVVSMFPFLFLILWMEIMFLLIPITVPIYYIKHRKERKDYLKQLSIEIDDRFEEQDLFRQQIINLSNFNLEISLIDKDMVNFHSFEDIYQLQYGEDSTKSISRIKIIIIPLVFLIFSLLSFLFIIALIWNFALILSNPEGFNKQYILDVLTSSSLEEDLQYIPDPLKLIYVINMTIAGILMLLMIGIVIPGKMVIKELSKQDPKFRKNFKQWAALYDIFSSMSREETRRREVLDRTGETANDSRENTVINHYIHIDKRNKKLKLKAIDPDWEIQDILKLFLKTWDLTGLFYFFLFSSFILSMIFSSFDPDTWSDPSTAIFGNIVYFGIYFGFYTFGLGNYGGQGFDSIKYYSIRSHLITEMRKQVVELSSKETVYFSRDEATNEEMDIKLDLLSARTTLESLEKLPLIPNLDKIINITKIGGLISILSILYSLLIL